ncbi:MAG TPA: V-type ATPase 116kDa subunit family protein [Spirochaetales bacterium]|nr:V-type ATPase 116kDa subunit family protein [Spirochaetales bacterium]
MIAPMKRVYIALQDKDRLAVLDALRKLGIVHLEPLEGSGETYEELIAAQKTVITALASIEEFVTKKLQQEQPSEPQNCALEIVTLAEAIKNDEEAVAALTKEIESIYEWGDFDPDLLNYLKGEGVALALYVLPKKKLSELDSSLEYIVIREDKGKVYLACVSKPQTNSETSLIHPEAVPCKLPSKRLSVLIAERTELQNSILQKKHALKAYAKYFRALKSYSNMLEKRINFEAVFSGMNSDTGIAWMAGWVPEKETEKFVAFAKQEHIAYVLDEPQAEELPPTKLENNAVVNMIRPVFDFIGSVPNYREYDISGLFLFFFTIFFAMIFGDGGYGSLLFLYSLYSIVTLVIKKKPVPDILKLISVLSGATIVWGFLSGSWFGINYEKLPPLLQSTVVSWIHPHNPQAEENIKVFCFIIGVIQLSIAHLKNILRDFPSPKFIGQLGQLGMLEGMFFVVLNLIVNPSRFPIPSWVLPAIGIGFLLSFLFSSFDDTKGNFIKGLLSGLMVQLQSIISVFLGVVNIFGDIISYIRLWAVGLAGLAMSQTVNALAGPVLGSLIKFLVAVVILFMGHGINIILSVLSVLVHGIRLNMLEFSSHLGMEWSGYGYSPFSEATAEKDVRI